MKRIGKIMVAAAVLLAGMLFPSRAYAGEKEKILSVTVEAGSTAEEIQEELNRAKEIERQGYSMLKVMLSPGSYKLNEGLVIYSNTTVVAEGSTLIKTHNEAPILRNYLYDKEPGINYAHDITVIGGIWCGSAGLPDARGDESFRFIHAKYVTIRDLTIKNIVSGHLLTLAGVEHAAVDGCTFSDYTTYGTGKEAVHLDLVHCDYMVPVVESSRDRILYDDAPCRDIQVTNCKFFNVPAGVGSHSAVRGVCQEDITVCKNRFINVETAAIRCYNYKDVLISENEVEQAGIGIQVYTYTSTSEIDDDKKTSFHIPLEGTKTEPVPEDHDYGINISNNKISTIYKGREKKFGNGIYIRGSKKRPIAHVKISSNRIKNSKGYGIEAWCAPKAVISDNAIENAAKKNCGSGIHLIRSDCVLIEENRITNSQIAITANGCAKLIYGNNRIEGSGYQDIHVTK